MTQTRTARARHVDFVVHRDGSDAVAWVVSYSSPPPERVLEAYRRRGMQCVPVAGGAVQQIIKTPDAWCVRNGKCERRRGGAGGKP